MNQGYFGAIETASEEESKAMLEINNTVQLVVWQREKGKMEKYWIVRIAGAAGAKLVMCLARYGEGKEPCGEDTKTEDGSACGPPYPKKERVW